QWAPSPASGSANRRTRPVPRPHTRHRRAHRRAGRPTPKHGHHPPHRAAPARRRPRTTRPAPHTPAPNPPPTCSTATTHADHPGQEIRHEPVRAGLGRTRAPTHPPEHRQPRRCRGNPRRPNALTHEPIHQRRALSDPLTGHTHPVSAVAALVLPDSRPSPSPAAATTRCGCGTLRAVYSLWTRFRMSAAFGGSPWQTMGATLS
ncbi:MAG: hypothetical protein QOD96_5590, partial [Pseudonocardiales bacterium]|nr:hypothetical protein [Pseudonocardiales bacterium]